jgi:hypothetical protein
LRFSTRLHGIIDYGLGLLLILMPFVVGLGTGAAGLTMVFVGVALLLVALFTDFELGLTPRVQMPVHLWVDGLLGLLLAFSPWLFVFYQTTWSYHVALGVILMVIAFLTHTVPGYDRRRSQSGVAE